MNKRLSEIASILEEVGSDPSRNNKETILRANKDNQLLQKVLEYTYNPYKIYGVGKKTLEGVEQLPITMILPKYDNIFELLTFLSENNINNEIRADIMEFLSTAPPNLRDLYVKMMLKDLRLGATAKSINKVFEGLIPTFDLMLAKKYENRADKIVGEKIVITTKIDGIRLAIVKDVNGVKFMTRQGKLVEGLTDIVKEVEELPNGVYDGELVSVNPEGLDSKELFAKTRKESGKKGAKKDLEYHVFDYLPCDEFKAGESKLNCLDRKQFITDVIGSLDLRWIKEVKVLEVTEDHSKIKHWLDKAIANGEEGVMINLANGKYECKRSNQILKVKQFHTVDVEIVDCVEGEGRLKGTLGRITVDYKGYPLGVGSGFSDAERSTIWARKEDYIGRIVEINYFEESRNEKNPDEISLRFPTYSRLRDDKKEASYY